MGKPEQEWRARRPEGGGFWPWEAKVLGAMLERMDPMTPWEVAGAAGLAPRTGENAMRLFRQWGWAERVGEAPKAEGKRRGPYLYELTRLGYRKAGEAEEMAARAKGEAGC